MKVFLSWSGERSRLVAELLDDWLQCVIQAADPWMSSKDIDRGALWFSEISDQLANTAIGIICLTKENRIKPWILFEAGALAKGISSARVCTFLIDLESTDVENPLAQFNHTKPDRVGLWDLVRTINSSLKELALKESILSKVFDTYWEQFDVKFQEIISSTPSSEKVEKRKGDEILLEVLSSVRNLDRKVRNFENSEKQLETAPPIGRITVLGRIKQLLRLGVPDETIVLNVKREFPAFPRSVIIERVALAKSELDKNNP